MSASGAVLRHEFFSESFSAGPPRLPLVNNLSLKNSPPDFAMRFIAALTALTLLPSIACAGSNVEVSLDEQPAAASTPITEASSQLSASTQAEFDHAHVLFDNLLKKHVKDGWLDYRGVIGEKEKLGAYLAQLEGVKPEELAAWSREQKYSFWINAYNAHVIQLVIDHFPVRSIKDIGGAVFGQVWDKEFIKLTAFHPDGDDDLLSLNDIEHSILRPRFKDARVHAAVNCASYSCPVLMGSAFTADKLEEQLERQMRLFVNDPLRNTIDPNGKSAKISSIFDWFEADFVRDSGSVRAYLQKYARPEAAKFLEQAELEFLDYGWSLNDIGADRK